MTVGSDVKSCFASVKNAEATLDMLATKTQLKETAEAYQYAQQLLTEVKNDLQQQVTRLMAEEPQYNK